MAKQQAQLDFMSSRQCGSGGENKVTAAAEKRRKMATLFAPSKAWRRNS
jgi:hypothetical protein